MTRVPPYQYFLKDRRQDVPIGHLLEASSHHSWGRFSFRGLNYPEITSLEDSVVPRPFFSRAQLSQVNFYRPEQNRCINWPLAHHLHPWKRYAARSSMFQICKTLIPMQTVKEISRILLLIKIPIPAVTKKSQCANHAATGICMTRTS